MKLWYHKLRNWEYWPVYLVYAPVFFYWIWMMIKFRSVSFYKYANPGIKNGGFYGDSKNDIYKLLPPNFFPKTILISSGEKYDFENLISVHALRFPLILKPDIGLRGIGVQRIHSTQEIHEYFNRTKNDFLIQECIELPNEIGLFYVKIPDEKTGKITGITLKKFLTVEGDSKNTILQLLKKESRSEMQISKLKNTINLNEILAKEEKRLLVPYGNHNRGTEFLDGTELITEKLEQYFNEILSNVPGFYYGRLDIRYNTFEELEKGLNFSIIEINGVKSEPTHIYDSKHNFWYGQMEIFRHQKVMQEVVKLNVKRLRKGEDFLKINEQVLDRK